MEFQVNTNNVILAQINQVESGEYNVTECNFTFSSEYEGLTKKAVFTGEDGTAYLQTIVDNKCSIPSEILATSQVVQIGVYAYAVENEKLILRYSPEPTDFFIHEGSYKEAQNSTPPTPSEIEQLQAQITQNANDIDTLETDVGNIQGDIANIEAEQTEQNTKIQKNTDDIGEINQDINVINQNIDNLEQDLTNYSLITETGSQINLNVNSTNYQITAILKDKNGNVIYTSNAIDLPIESMIVNASYDNTTKEIVLTLQNGNTLRISVADLISGLVSETQLQTILANYYNKTEVDNLLSVKANQSSLDTTNQNLSNLAGRVSTNEEDIADIKEEQTTQNTNIEELQNQVETLQEDLDNANSEIEELNTDISNMRKAMITVDGQGSDITLPNTSENKFVEFGLEGRTEQDGEPTPETPIPIKNVTGNANVKIQNKNLFIFEDLQEKVKSFNITGEKENFTITRKSTSSYNYPLSLPSGESYTFSGKWSTTYGNGAMNVIYTDGTSAGYILTNYSTSSANGNISLTTNASKTISHIKIELFAGGNYTIENLQIEQGTTATSYVEHQEQNYPFTFAEGQRAMQGTTLEDDGIHNKWYEESLINRNWSKYTNTDSQGNTFGFFMNLSKIPKRDTTATNFAKCNILMQKQRTKASTSDEEGFYLGDGTDTLFIKIRQSLIPNGTIEELQTLLTNTNAKIQFEVPEEEIIPYNSTQQTQYNAIKQARSYDDQTNISSTSDELGFNMNVVAVADANKVIDSELQEIKSAVIALGGDINV